MKNDIIEHVHPENCRKKHTLEMTEKAHPRNEGMENAQNGKWQKMRTRENDRKVTPGKWQNGKCTPVK